jgi:hypothetical protein
MGIIGHEAIGEDFQVMLVRIHAKQAQIESVIVIAAKNHLAVISAMRDVVWGSRANKASTPWHRVIIAHYLLRNCKLLKGTATHLRSLFTPFPVCAAAFSAIARRRVAVPVE